MVTGESRLVEQGAGALFGRLGDAHQALQQLTEVLVRLAALDDGDQALERLAEVRVSVDRAQLVARAARLVPERLRQDAQLVQKDGLGSRRFAGIVLRAQTLNDRRHQCQVRRRGLRLGRLARAHHESRGILGTLVPRARACHSLRRTTQ